VPITGFQEIASRSPDAMLLLARDGTILAANGAAEASLSSTGKPVVGVRLAELSVETAEHLDAYLGRCARSGEPLPGALRLLGQGAVGLRVRTWGARAAHRGALVAGAAATIALRFQPDGVTHAELLLLNGKIAELGREILRRRATEDELRETARQLREELAGRRAAEDAADRLAKLQTLTLALSRVSRLEDVAAAAVAHAPAALETTVATLYVCSLEGSAIERVSYSGLPEELFPRTLPIAGSSPSGTAVRTGEPQWLETHEAMHEHEHAPAVAAGIRYGLTSGAFLPLVGMDGRILGALGLGFCRPKRLLDGDRAFALLIADLCAQAVDRALAHARAERAMRFTAQLAKMTAAFSQALTPADVAQVVVTEGRSALGAAHGSGWMLNEEGDVLELLTMVGRGEAAATAYRRVPLTAAIPAAEAVRSGAALFLETSAEVLARFPAINFFDDADEHAVAVVPLSSGAQVVGVIGFVFHETRRFDAAERAFIGELASKCSLALERARLYEVSVRARYDAEVANRAKDDFLSTVSHELRTPLTAVLGWASILRSRMHDPDAVARGLTIIERNARAQAQLIEDILDVSRMVTGKLRLEVAIVDAAAIVQAAVDLVQPTAEGRGVTIAVTVDPAVGFFAADPARFQQIAGNLLSNAVKFTPRGGQIAVKLERVGEDVRLRIADSGKGIAPELLPHVFDQFRQGESHSARSQGGLGLGLAIVKHLVELHDGTITAESAGEGCGATLTVTLPRAPWSANLHVGAGVGSDPPTPALLRLDGVRVLIVDDNVDTREMIATVLQDQGAISTVAGSAADALSAILVAPPHVLISDVGMPLEDGYSLLRRVRALAPIPAIALTAYTGAHDARMAELAGFDRHLAKPIVPARLVDAVARLAARLGVI
jgi:signal transduction histidine kinase